MADDGEKKTSELIEEAKRAILNRIISSAPSANDARLPGMAHAYALVVGSARGYLPGAPYPTDVSASG